MILSDRDIRRYIEDGRLSIEPLSNDTIRENGIDLRFSGRLARFKKEGTFVPGSTRPENFYEIVEYDKYVIKPSESILISTLEYVKFPDNLIGFINLRSSYARLGMILSPTIIDAGFEGVLTVAITSNMIPIELRRGERILHVILAELSTPSDNPYRGIYRGRRDITLPFHRD